MAAGRLREARCSMGPVPSRHSASSLRHPLFELQNSCDVAVSGKNICPSLAENPLSMVPNTAGRADDLNQFVAREIEDDYVVQVLAITEANVENPIQVQVFAAFHISEIGLA